MVFVFHADTVTILLRENEKVGKRPRSPFPTPLLSTIRVRPRYVPV